MRNTWAAYLVNASTGKIEWTLGGKRSSFKMSPSVRFEWQHDVVLLEGSQVSLFDDECCQITGAGTYLAPAGASRGLVLKLNVANRTVSLVAQYKHDNGSAAYMGSTQLLSNGNVFIGWGDLPYFSEYSKTGKLLLDAILPGPDLSYRAIQIPHWVGLPTYPPAGAVRDVNGKTVVYASWNGATRVVAWKVLAGPSPPACPWSQAALSPASRPPFPCEQTPRSSSSRPSTPLVT